MGLEEKPFLEILTHIKRFNLFMVIDNKNPLIKKEISKKADVEYGYAHEMIDVFEELGLVEIKQRSKRSQFVFRTDRGKKLKRYLLKIKEIVEENR